MPEDVLPYKNNQEALRALRILGKLRSAGIIKAFYTTRHNYGDEPPAYVTLVRLTENDTIGMSGKSAHLTDKSVTFWPALGEALERYAIWNTYLKKGKHLFVVE